MGRKKVRSIRLFSRISENNMSDKELDFVEGQLKNQSKAKFVRQAVKIYHKYYTGELFKEVLSQFDIGGKDELMDEYEKELDEVIKKDFF